MNSLTSASSRFGEFCKGWEISQKQALALIEGNEKWLGREIDEDEVRELIIAAADIKIASDNLRDAMRGKAVLIPRARLSARVGGGMERASPTFLFCGREEGHFDRYREAYELTRRLGSLVAP